MSDRRHHRQPVGRQGHAPARHAPAGHTSDAAKIGIVRRVGVGCARVGGRRGCCSPTTATTSPRERVDRSASTRGVAARRAADRRRALDTVAAAAAACGAHGAGAVVVLGGDGTCRDVAIGWPDAPLVADLDGHQQRVPRRRSTARPPGAPPGSWPPARSPLAGVGPAHQAARRRRRATGSPTIALVDVALIDTAFTGARAVADPATVRAVVACDRAAGEHGPVRASPGGCTRSGGASRAASWSSPRRHGAAPGARPDRAGHVRHRRRVASRRPARRGPSGADSPGPACSPTTASATAGSAPARP